MRVLVVEDYAPIRKAVAKSLREAGFAVDETGDGEEGLWYATSNNGTTKARPAGVPRNSLEGPGSARLDLRWSHEIELGRGEDGRRPPSGWTPSTC